MGLNAHFDGVQRLSHDDAAHATDRAGDQVHAREVSDVPRDSDQTASHQLAGFVANVPVDKVESEFSITLAAGGLLVAVVGLGIAAATGVLPVELAMGAVDFIPFDAPVWAVLAALGVITAGVSYVTGIAATRRLGPRLASFIALSEVLAATLAAWFLLGQAPGPMQIGGAALVLAGVVVVKLGEREVIAPVAAEAPVLEDLAGFGQFLQNLKNQGMHPYLMGDFPVEPAPRNRRRPARRPYLVKK